jgi:hypothetical protein
MNEQVRGPEWRPEANGSGERNRRGWSIDELRTKLGVAAPEMQTEAGRASRKTEVTMMAMERPRIVRRGEAPILA